MKLIIGLGNPGKEYADTRHNIGFAMLDKIQQEFNFPIFEFNKKFNALISKSSYPLLQKNVLPYPPSPCFKERVGERLGEGAQRADEGKGSAEELLLTKPQTFMNLSGTAVKSILDFYKLTPDDILVIQDDLDVAVGKYKIAADSSSAGHNGIQNIIDQLGTQKFKRIRIGIGEETPEGAIKCRLGAHDFVLGKFSDAEKEKIENIFGTIIEKIKGIL